MKMASLRATLAALAAMLALNVSTPAARATTLLNQGATTLDPNTGLEWLDVSLTDGQSINAVQSGFGGYVAAGFHVATVAEVVTLFANAGLVPLNPATAAYSLVSSSTAANYGPAFNFVSLVGSTDIFSGVVSGQPAFTTAAQGWAFADQTHTSVRDPFVSYTTGLNPEVGTECSCGYHTDSSATFREVGVWLVRDATDVPEPASLALFGTGLLGLGLLRRTRITRGMLILHRRRVSLAVFIGALTLLATQPARADFLQMDWLTPGDGLIVRDTTTGRDWLKPRATNGLSMADVVSQTGPGGHYAGWSVPALTEIHNLVFVEFGFPFPGYNVSPGGTNPAQFAIASSFIGTFGYTYDDPLRAGGFFYLGGKFDVGSLIVDGIVSIAITNGIDDSFYGVYLCCNRYSQTDIGTGVFLVRDSVLDVPEPASLALFGTGLLGLGVLSRRRRARVFGASLLITLCALTANQAAAIPVTLTATNGVEVRVHFTAPVQPIAHNAIVVGPLSYSVSPGGFVDQAAIFENGVLLASGSYPNFPGGRFTAPSSFFAATSHGAFDFAAIADGVTDGMIAFSIISGTGAVQFDTNTLSIRTFGDAGGFPAYFPTITRVEIVTNTPEPASLALFGTGLLGLAAVRRRLFL